MYYVYLCRCVLSFLYNKRIWIYMYQIWCTSAYERLLGKCAKCNLCIYTLILGTYVQVRPFGGFLR